MGSSTFSKNDLIMIETRYYHAGIKKEYFNRVQSTKKKIFRNFLWKNNRFLRCFVPDFYHKLIKLYQY